MRPLMNILSEGADCTLARARGRAWAEPGKSILLPGHPQLPSTLLPPPAPCQLLWPQAHPLSPHWGLGAFESRILTC